MSETQGPDFIPLAVIGMACRLPGANNLDEFWRLIEEGRTAIDELPTSRLDQGLYYDPKVGERGKTYSKLGAILSPSGSVPEKYPVPPELARTVDHAHVLMCQVAA